MFTVGPTSLLSPEYPSNSCCHPNEMPSSSPKEPSKRLLRSSSWEETSSIFLSLFFSLFFFRNAASFSAFGESNALSSSPSRRELARGSLRLDRELANKEPSLLISSSLSLRLTSNRGLLDQELILHRYPLQEVCCSSFPFLLDNNNDNNVLSCFTDGHENAVVLLAF